MEITKLTQTDWIPSVTRFIQNGEHKLGYVVFESSTAAVHRKMQVDEDVCNELGYEIVETFNNCGTIVANPGDFGIGHVGAHDNGWYLRFVEHFLEWLNHRGLNAVYVDNDILVDGYKVCGICVNRYGCIDYTGGLIGINTKLDDIKVICTKPMKKVPKGLSEYGITTEDMERMFLDFCEKDDQLIKEANQNGTQ